MTRKRRRLPVNWGLWDPRLGWAKSGGKPLYLGSDLKRARMARDQWNLAGGHLGADWQLKPHPR